MLTSTRSVALLFNQKRTGCYLPCQWIGCPLNLLGSLSEGKFQLCKMIKQKKSTLCFLSDWKCSKTRRQKKCVRVRKSCPVEALKFIRFATVKFSKHFNLTSTLDLVHGIRNQVLAVYLTKRKPLSCLFLFKSSAIEAWRLTPRCILNSL